MGGLASPARADSGASKAPVSIADKQFGNTGIEECRAYAADFMRGIGSDATPRVVAQEYTTGTTQLSADTSFTGDVRIDSAATLDLNGNQLTITGNLEVFGTLIINNGTLIVKSGSVLIDNGLLQMANGSITVTGSFFARSRDETGALTGGTITVKGNFIQYKDNSRKSFCPTGTKVVITGSGRLLSFDSPDGSWLGPYDFSQATFNSLSVFSLSLSLGSDQSLTYPHLYIRGQLNDHKLTVPANTLIEGQLTLGGGWLAASGTLLVDGTGAVSMTNSNDRITVAGNFYTGGVCDIQTGSVELNGNFYQYGPITSSSFHENSWVSKPASKMKITGSSRIVKFDTPATSCFGQLDSTGASFTTDSVLSLNFDLASDVTLSYYVSSIYYGGHLNGNTLRVTNSPFYAARQIVLGGGTLDVAKTFTASAENSLIMTGDSDHVIARGDFITSGKMDDSSMTAGMLDIYGNFTQTGNAASFIASGTHVTRFFGLNKTVQFANPAQSWFCKVVLVSGASLAARSTISMMCDLDASHTYTVSTLYYGGYMGGHNLTVNGNLHIFGNTDPGGGTLKATGAVALDGVLTMSTPTDKLEAGGDFTGSGTADLNDGSTVFKGGFHYTGTSYAAYGEHVTTLSGGPGMSVIFDNPSQSYFAAVVLSPGTTLSSASKLSVKTTGVSDLSFNLPMLYLQGNLKGTTVTQTGNLIVPYAKGVSLTIGGGTLNVSGNMTLGGTLVMTNAADLVKVGGSFVAEGPDETGRLTNGRLFINGNFSQVAVLSEKSFVCTIRHKTILSGISTQTVVFNSPGVTGKSTFGTLYRINPSISFNTSITACSLANVVTSANLLPITGDGGVLVPAFSAGKYDYIYVLPEGADSTTLSINPQSGNATVAVNATEYTSFPAYVPVTGVPDGGDKTVVITVKAKDDVVENTYTVKVEKLDDSLQAIGLSAGAPPLTPAFDADTTLYTVTLPASVESLTVTPQAHNPDATFTINGQAVSSKTVTLRPGESSDVNIVVTGQDGESQKAYKVTVTRGDLLSGFGQSTGSLSRAFFGPVAAYDLNISALQGSVSITPQPTGECTNILIDGADKDSASYALNLGQSKAVTVTAFAGEKSFTYTLTLKRAPIISGFYDPSQFKAGMVLMPAFDAEGDAGAGPFTLTVPASVTSLFIQPPKGPQCSSVSINGGGEFIDLDNLQPGFGTVLHIKATASESGSTVSRTFTLTVRKNPIVTNLTPSEGTLTQKLDPSRHVFDPTVPEYYVDISATDAAIHITPTLKSGSVTINGQAYDPDNPVTLSPTPGTTGVFTIAGSDGTGTAIYKVYVNRHEPVSGIHLSTGTLSPAFNAATKAYTVSLPITAGTVTITPTKTSQCTSLKINGVVRDSFTVSLPLGGTATVKIETTSGDAYGSSSNAYTVSIDRETLISDLDVTSGTISPMFDGCTLGYSLYLPATTSSVTLTPEKTSSCKSFTINGNAVSHLSVTVPAGGMTTATIKATGTSSSYMQTFTIKIYRISPVTSIKLSTGTLSPAFSLSKTAYTVSLPASKASVTITPTKVASCKSLTIDGVAKTSVTLSPKIGCSLKTTIVATAVNGVKYTWTVTVNRGALLKGIKLSAGTLTPAFSVLTANYSANVSATTSSVTVTPVKASTGVYSMTINGSRVSSVTLHPAIGDSATATVVLTASDRKTKQTYKVVVHRAPLLTGIAPSVGTISPAFDPAKQTYTVTIPSDSPSTKLTLSRAASGVKSITVNGYNVSATTVTVAKPGGSTTVKIIATATNGTTKATYTVVVKRAPVISGITVTGGALSPAFSSGTTSYTVSVPATTSKITLKPLGTASCSSITIDGAVLASKSFYPPVGGSVTATIVGKTALGAACTYTVKISRAALITGIKTSSSTYHINPAFSATTLTYTVSIPSSKSSITIYATKASTGVKSMKINGKAVTYLLVKPPVGGSVTVTITALATDGKTTVTYKVIVKRAS